MNLSSLVKFFPIFPIIDFKTKFFKVNDKNLIRTCSCLKISIQTDLKFWFDVFVNLTTTIITEYTPENDSFTFLNKKFQSYQKLIFNSPIPCTYFNYSVF